MKARKITEAFLMIIGLLLAVLGVVTLCNPSGAMHSVLKVVGVCLIVIGIGMIVFVLTVGQILLFTGGAIGSAIMNMLFGILFLTSSAGVGRLFVILYALVLIAVGLAAFIGSFIVKHLSDGKGWIGVIIFSILMFVLGIVAIKNPTAGNAIFMIPVGLILIIVGAAYAGISIAMIRGNNDQRFFKAADIPTESADDNGEDKYYTDVED